MLQSKLIYADKMPPCVQEVDAVAIQVQVQVFYFSI